MLAAAAAEQPLALPEGAQVGRVAAGADVVPDAAVVARGVEERGPAVDVVAELEPRPEPGLLGQQGLGPERGGQPASAAAGIPLDFSSLTVELMPTASPGKMPNAL